MNPPEGRQEGRLPEATGERALELHVRGVVQGVGFRPFVHRLALRHGLAGWVRNEAGEVRILAQGREPALERFVRALREERPPLARVDALELRETAPEGWAAFQVIPSALASAGRLPVSPDVALCSACREELMDPSDRRHRYPFITCTDCGPRFTVIQAMPYDRVRTSMASFNQCAPCLEEYRDPGHRRYHSETNSCPDCGPRIWFEGSGGEAGRVERTEEALRAATGLLRQGGVLAVKGLGGFHLAVDARQEEAVIRLRARKGREGKPLALMARSLQEARGVAGVGPAEARLLASAESPIVLLEKKDRGSLAPSLSPGLDTLGIMLPYTPLHHLLLEGAGTPLVMTSGNASEEPIATGNQEARERLGSIADGFLLHDREIVARYDDSVVRVVGDSPLLLRRARGYAPLPLLLPFPALEPLLAVGPHLKNTFSLVHGESVFMSQHIGDLETLESLQHFQETLDRFRSLFRVEPRRVVRDLHPGYLSTRVARELAEAWGLPEPLAVQHHHAHVAAVAAEHGEEGAVVGVAYDGTGYGEDGRVWGGEILVADLRGYRRAGRLRYAPLPGGEAAVREPWRTALGYLTLEPDREGVLRLAMEGVPVREVAVARRQAERGLNAPLASSMGRLFDAAAAVLGLRQRCRFEGQAAMELEALAREGWPAAGSVTGRRGERLPFPFARDAGGVRVLDPLPLLGALGEGRQRGEPPEALAAAFHESVAWSTGELVQELCQEEELESVALGGGVFQNALLLVRLTELLEARGLRVLRPRALSPNDGAISYGQAAVAAARLREGG